MHNIILQGEKVIKKIMLSVLILIVVLVLAVIVLFAVKGSQSRSGEAPGITNGKLATCPDKPNCASSENPSDTAHFVEPISTSLGDDVFNVARKAIGDMGGTVTQTGENYLAAEFKSSLFGFVDDFELRLDKQSSQLHVRSASRVGHSDLGINAKRVDQFKTLLKAN